MSGHRTADSRPRLIPPAPSCSLRRTAKLPLGVLAPFLLPAVPRGTPAPPIVWRDLYGNDHPVEVEVGFGKGLFLTTAATACPDVNFFGVEIVRKYQLFAATRLVTRGLTNVRVACADGNLLLRDRMAPGSVRAVHVYFPDPWWKTRHKRRRVFSLAFAGNVAAVLQPGGRLHIVSDVEEYFGVMTAIVRDLSPLFRELPPLPPTDPTHDIDYLTNFERKFRKEGRPIYRAAYGRTDIPVPLAVVDRSGQPIESPVPST